ncbi:MAG: hypothetical protein EO766_02900 [Hydrotalea sp. AMD]|uniref:hypothetical protein n=1 Tax=Hydrotalea sp. AMD TaxID=2501297 RepID=UPI0010266583|nr:hypothetical protein [Hydrotalea sp. AMD]RWZ90369.1 MAG: hypothetical protein EO766_02900 [Hydrotalea sp. AMD]
MKKYLLMALLLCNLNISFGQVMKFRSSIFSLKTKGTYGWTKWSEPTEVNILIVFDLDKNRITIYSKETQVYDIYQTYEKYTDSDGDDTFEYACVDANGLRCHVRWLKLNSQNGRLQVYVDYSDMMLMYNVKLLE